MKINVYKATECNFTLIEDISFQYIIYDSLENNIIKLPTEIWFAYLLIGSAGSICQHIYNNN